MADGSRGWTARIEALSPRGLWWTAVLASAAAVLAVTGLVGLALQGSSWWIGWQPVVRAVLVVAVVPVIGLWPLGACDPADSKRISRAAYTGTPIRMLTAGVLGALVLLSLPDKPGRVAFALWLGGLYLVSLLVEMVVLAVWLRGRTSATRV